MRGIEFEELQAVMRKKEKKKKRKEIERNKLNIPINANAPIKYIYIYIYIFFFTVAEKSKNLATVPDYNPIFVISGAKNNNINFWYHQC